MWLKQHGTNERRFARDLKGLFESQYLSVLEAVKNSGGDWKPETVYQPEQWQSRLLTIARKHLAQSAAVGAWTYQAVSGKAKDDLSNFLITLPDEIQAVVKQAIQDTLEEDYWNEINRETLKRLRRVLQRTILEGWGLRDQVTELNRVLGPQISGMRALTIARTETTAALNSGSYAVQQDLAQRGLIQGKEWLAAIDEATRQAHREANGQQAGVMGLFRLVNPKTGLEEFAPYPGYHKLSAAQRVHCRCTSISVRAG